MAVIGASDRPGNIGGAAVRFFRKFNSPCVVYPVNSRGEPVAGLPAYPSMAALPQAADLAILAVPAAAVPETIAKCAEAGTKAGIVWAGGFVEGGEEGAARQRALVAICRKTGFLALGPNCLGVIDTHGPMTASFASMMLAVDRLLPGNISMVSQSGGLATIAHALAQQQGVGFRYTISTGNEAVLGVADFLRALVDDPETKVIALYLEGSRDGDKIRRALAAARDVRKPVIVLKAGATAASAIAAAAHTGALAGERRVWDAVLRSAAAIPAESLEELLDLALLLSGAELSRMPTSRGVAAITFGGGSGVLSADQCDRAGLAVPPLGAGTRTALAGNRPAAGVDAKPGRSHAADLSRPAMARELSASARRDRRRSGDRNDSPPVGADVGRRREARRIDRRVSRPMPHSPSSPPGHWRWIRRARCSDPPRCIFIRNTRGPFAQSAGSPPTRRISRRRRKPPRH